MMTLRTSGSGAPDMGEWLELLEALGVPFAVADIHGAILSESAVMKASLGCSGGRQLLTSAARDLIAALRHATHGKRIARSSRGLPATGFAFGTSPVRILVILASEVTHVGRAFQRDFCALTSREREVAVLLASPMSTREIAGRLGISLHTMRRHTESVFRKLGVRSRVAVAEYVIGAGQMERAEPPRGTVAAVPA